MSRRGDISTDLAEKAGLPVDRFPSSEDEVQRAECVLAQAIGELSLEEHEKIIFDFHGFSKPPEVDDVVIQACMTSLDKEIAKISSKEAYELAVEFNKEYVLNHDFRVMFLRACDFDPIGAATMIVKHFEKKRELFEEKVLARDILQSDLSPEDLEFVRDGRCQLVPSRDAAGRFIVVYNVDRAAIYYTAFIQRPLFYLYMAFLREKEITKSGVIWICYIMNSEGIGLDGFKAVNEMESILPLWGVGGHYCSLPSPSVRASIAGIRLFFDRADRFRSRTHMGSLEENTFKLQTYGIPTQDCPMKADGTWSTEFHLQWLEGLRSEEEKQRQNVSTTNDLIVVPRKFDVLCGKSQLAKNSSGTQRALHLVDAHRDTYESRSKYEKTEVAKDILSLIHKSGGRFLKESKEPGRWEEMDDLAARQKISHWFRHLRFKENVGGKVSDFSESSENSAQRKSRSNDFTKQAPSIVSDHEDGGPTKRLAPSLDLDPSLELDDDLLDGMFSLDSIFVDGVGVPEEIHALENPAVPW